MVENKNTKYSLNYAKWKLCRDAVSANVRHYVPRLEGQTDEEYEAYTGRPAFYNATARTLDSLVGLIMSKPPEFEANAQLMSMAENITLNGDTIEQFSKMILKEVMTTGRGGILVDAPNVARGELTRAKAEALNIRPYMRFCTAESIINWKTTVINGITTLSMVVIEEDYEYDISEFETDTKKRYLVLDILEGIYRQRVYEIDDKKDILVSEFYPVINGSNINYIPFIFVGVDDLKETIENPPLIDLVNVNVAHFKNNVDLEHGAHFTALPTPYVSGYQKQENEVFKIGSTELWIFSDPSATANYLEFQGSGLSTLQTMIEAKEKQMAVLGARLLLDEKKTAESTDTVAMRSSGEKAVLLSMAITVSSAVKRGLEIIAEWEGLDNSIIFNLNTDYNLTTVNPQLLQQLMAGVQGGNIPLSVLFYNMKEGELIPENMDLEEFQGQIQTATPQLSVNDNTSSLNSQVRTALGL